MDYAKESLRLHYKWRGKQEMVPKVPLANKEDLSLAYTPGVAAPCLEIQKHPEASYQLTGRGNTVAVVTDGSAVLGLGNIGAEAALPVMEGKCVLFKAFAGIDAVPLCINSQKVDDIVRTVELLQSSFGGINLEDIAAPRCFEVEAKLKERCDIPVFHDDQHGTAVVVLAALSNALRVVGKKMAEVSVVISGAGAAGVAIAKLLLACGVTALTVCDIDGTLYDGRANLNAEQQNLAAATNPQKKRGTLADALEGADVFIGVSAGGIVSQTMVQTMTKDAVVFALANPTPEIMPADATQGGAAVVGTGRSDFANQINNVLAFPALFKGALSVRAATINDTMKLAAAGALAQLVPPEKLSAEYILPDAFDERLVPTVAKAVADAALQSGAAQS